MGDQYLHIAYIPENGWVLTIMSRLFNCSNPRLKAGFDRWSDTPLKELGLAITTRMHMLGLCIRRLNAHVAELRTKLNADREQLDYCLSKGAAFQVQPTEAVYELLIDMDSFIFETRSLYEIVGKFLTSLFQIVFDRKITQAELKSLLESQGIDTRWIGELAEARKHFFHETAPWLAVKVHVDAAGERLDPILLKRNIITFENTDDFVDFSTLKAIYDGFVASVSELHRYILEQIRIAEEKFIEPKTQSA